MNAAWLSSVIALSVLVPACVDSSSVEKKPDAPDCSAPAVACGSVCSELETDPAHCGTCGRACAAGDVCSAGECLGECPGGETSCAGGCRDLTSDGRNCGGCDRPCADGFQCVGGACIAESGGEPSSDPRVRTLDGKFNVCGRPVFMNGANTPWHRWNDFGGEYDETWWSIHFGDLHDTGVNSSRVWITCNGEVGIDIDADGVVHGATDAHWADLDGFFAVAAERKIYVMATLMSFDHFEDMKKASFQAWIASDANIDSYVENYLIPFLERYRDNPYLFSIDLINEPDWVYERQGISFDRLRAYFARAARAIHENSDVLVTVGMASPKYNAACAGCEPQIDDDLLREAVDEPSVYLDFYSSHYYDWVGTVWGNTLYLSPESTSFPPGKPVMIGEFPARGTSGHTLTEDIEAAHENGHQGTMPWTSNGVDRNGGFPQVSVAAAAFRDAHLALVFPSCP